MILRVWGTDYMFQALETYGVCMIPRVWGDGLHVPSFGDICETKPRNEKPGFKANTRIHTGQVELT